MSLGVSHELFEGEIMGRRGSVRGSRNGGGEERRGLGEGGKRGPKRREREDSLETVGEELN